MEKWYVIAKTTMKNWVNNYSLGTPVELSPDNNDPSIASDDNKINNFVFDQSKQQARCPFASHMRKSNPRNDVTPVDSAFKHL